MRGFTTTGRKSANALTKQNGNNISLAKVSAVNEHNQTIKHRSHSKLREYLKVSAVALLVLLIGAIVSMYSELFSALILFVGLVSAIRMAVLVHKGGGAFD
jgi:Na+/H+-translocating membrane pyrophosphatase